MRFDHIIFRITIPLTLKKKFLKLKKKIAEEKIFFEHFFLTFSKIL